MLRRSIRSLLLLCFLLGAVEANAQAWKTAIGWTQLFNEVGPGLEDGTGISVLLTEAPVGGNYMPDTAHSEFTGKTITNGSGPNNTPSGHATSMAISFFGNTQSVAPGVTNITVFDANDWINTKLNFASQADPLAHPFRVSNNSWIGTGTPIEVLEDISRRSDFVALQNQMTVVGGTNNGSTNPLPQYLAHTYNSIIVGRTDGNHASGQTSAYGPPRFRPDIVAPAGTTSQATAIVSSVAAMLHQKAAGTNADRIDVMRSVILAGATRDLFPGWNRTSTQPMDAVFGAGQVNVYNSYHIIDAGEQEGSTTPHAAAVSNIGWDYREVINPGLNDAVYYDFIVPNNEIWQDLTIALTWNMLITDTNPNPAIFAPVEQLGNLDLHFFETNTPFWNLLDSSVAVGGNVEFLTFAALNPGQYTLRVSLADGDLSRDYGLAWTSRIFVIPEPSFGSVFIVVTTFMLARRRRRGAQM
ncbi:MAG TPA: S8/S53 family peptidase [Pirellulaceae bacterium]|nr:S8/S53 family peptidase [Pirellulaceae bacterium]HMO93693.1 S8/S53 family peptidase [Pirellulaceae bacterium]HMP71274.1 S8/S53 family peptidase [Pirellulaceae bacterium]